MRREACHGVPRYAESRDILETGTIEASVKHDILLAANRGYCPA